MGEWNWAPKVLWREEEWLLWQCSTMKIMCVGTKEETNLCNCTIESELHINPLLERPPIHLQLNQVWNKSNKLKSKLGKVTEERRSRSSLVGIVTKLQAGIPGDLGLTLSRYRNLSLLNSTQTGSADYPAWYLIDTVCFPGVKATGAPNWPLTFI